MIFCRWPVIYVAKIQLLLNTGEEGKSGPCLKIVTIGLLSTATKPPNEKHDNEGANPSSSLKVNEKHDEEGVNPLLVIENEDDEVDLD